MKDKKQINLYIDELNKISDKDLSSLKYTILNENKDLYDYKQKIYDIHDIFDHNKLNVFSYDCRIDISNFKTTFFKNKIGYIKSGKEYAKNINELIQKLNFLIF